ncbi:MAG: hypothetical protein AAF657_31415, partial [Acidobacteriota bacterium]
MKQSAPVSVLLLAGLVVGAFPANSATTEAGLMLDPETPSSQLPAPRVASWVELDVTGIVAPGQSAGTCSAPLQPLSDQVAEPTDWSYPDPITEELFVTGKAPLIENVISCPGAEIVDLEPIPLAREPWSWVVMAPGVLADRESRSGAAAAPRFSGWGAADDQNAIRLDGFEIADDSSGEPSFDFGHLRPEEVVVRSGVGLAGLSTSGLEIELTTRSSGKTWHASGGHLAAVDSGVGTGSQRLRFSANELEAGGALGPDRLFFWGALSDRNSEQTVLGGQTIDAELEHSVGKLQLLYDPNTISMTWHRGETDENGRGAGPDRAASTTWNHDNRAQLLRLEADRIQTPNLFLSGGYGKLDRRVDAAPLGGLEAASITDRSGVARGTSFRHGSEATTEEWRFTGGHFSAFAWGNSSLEIGARWRRHQTSKTWLGGRGQAVEAGENVSLAGDMALVARWHDTDVRIEIERRALWLQDELQRGRLSLTLGLRFDGERGASRETSMLGDSRSTADWRRVLPRLGFTAKLGGSERVLLRAGYGRFASRLGPLLGARRFLGFPSVDFSLFSDVDSDLQVDAAERLSLVSWYGVLPDRVADDIGPESTEEVLIGIERELFRRWAVGLTLNHRRSRDLLERRTLVQRRNRDGGPGGEVFQAVAEDWVVADSLSGRLPDGQPYRVDVYDLRPDLKLAPWGLWVNGDRRQEILAAALTWRGRTTGGRWRSSGHITWNARQWHLGPNFLRHDDPTGTVGSGDDDGHRFVGHVVSDLGGAQAAVDSPWSLHVRGSVRLPHAIDLGLSLNGRSGYPLPYFRRVARGAGVARVELTERVDSIRAP